MGEKYVKDGKIYEKQVFGEDREIGEIKWSFTGEYADTKTLGEGPYDVERNPFTGETKVTTRRDYLSNTEEGFTIERNPFKPHGQESQNWQHEIWPSHDAEGEEDSASHIQGEQKGSSSSYSSEPESSLGFESSTTDTHYAGLAERSVPRSGSHHRVDHRVDHRKRHVVRHR